MDVQVRSLIEPEVFRVAASSLTERGLEDVRQTAKKVPKPETIRSHVAFPAADRAFRIALAELSGNLRLARLMDQIRDQSERVLHFGSGRQPSTLRLRETITGPSGDDS